MSDGINEPRGSVSIADRVDLICDQFERQWILQAKPRLEDYLNGSGIPDRALLFRELLAIELEYRARCGEHMTADEYTTRFAAWSADISAVFDSVNRARTGAGARKMPGENDSVTIAGDPSLGVILPRAVSPTASTLTLADLSGSASLGKFRLDKVVGSGAFGEVFRAYDTELDRYVAVKLPRADTSDTGEASLMLREAKNVSRLKHPGIVPVFDVGRTDAVCYIISEFVEGPTLARELQRRRFTRAESCELIAQLADALDYAHDEGVVHRDLKPSNILLEIRAPGSSLGGRKAAEERGPRIIPRVVDFGLGKRTLSGASISSQGEVLGTPGYMSPEQAAGETYAVDRRSDVYSLGVIFYQLLTGEVPFRGDLSSLIEQVIKEPPRRPRAVDRSVPRDLEVICLKCLAKSPHDRYQHAADLAADLRRWLEGMPIEARPVSWVGRSWRWCRRYPGLAAMIALALLLAVGGGAAITLQHIGRLEVDRKAAKATIENLLNIESSGLAEELRQIHPRAVELAPPLRERIADDSLSEPAKMRLRLALLPTMPELEAESLAVALLEPMLKTADAHEFLVLREALSPYASRLVPLLESRLKPPVADPVADMRPLLALIEWAPKARDLPADAAVIASGIARAPHAEIPVWLRAATRVQQPLRKDLEQLFASDDQMAASRTGACRALTVLCAADPQMLVHMLLTATDDQHPLLVSALSNHKSAARLLRGQLAAVTATASSAQSVAGDPLRAQRQSNVFAALLQLGGADHVWPELAHGPNPCARSYLIHTIKAKGVSAEQLAQRLEIETDPGALYTLLLALSRYTREDFLPQRFPSHLAEVLEKYQHRDAGVHSAARYVLTKWGEEAQWRSLNLKLRQSPVPGANWYINYLGQTMVLVSGNTATGRFGAITAEEASDSSPDAWKQLRWTFAIAATETTWDEIRALLPQYPKSNFEHGQTGDHPAYGISVPDALEFCRLLNEKDVSVEGAQSVVRVSPSEFDVDLESRGYRLPLEIEWQRACRAGTETSRFYGEKHETLALDYVQGYSHKRADRVAAKMPNQFGLFDTLGNLYELTLDEGNHSGNLVGNVRPLRRRIVCTGLAPDAPGPQRSIPGSRLITLGGSFWEREVECSPNMRSPLVAQAVGREMIGMRVVRTIHMPSKTENGDDREGNGSELVSPEN